MTDTRPTLPLPQPDPLRPSPNAVGIFRWSRTSPGNGWALVASIARPGWTKSCGAQIPRLAGGKHPSPTPPLCSVCFAPPAGSRT